jgi:ubiquinone/menaquinone biosynthesis C-methylase UbiE
MNEQPKHKHVCPYWLGYFLINPFRKFRQNPYKILSPYIKEGMTVLEIGPGMGFFSLTLAKLVGSNGKLICIDVQEKMLLALKKRAAKAGVERQTETRIANSESLNISDLKERIDCAIAFYVVHEIPDVPVLFKQIHESLKAGGKLLIAEPKGHVTQKAFDTTIRMALETGFRGDEKLLMTASRGVVLYKYNE